MKNLLIITMLLGIGYADCNESNWQDYYPDMQGCYLQEANLAVADLEGADLTGANLYGADLFYADLSDANLQYANLTGACLEGAIGFTQTNYNGTPILEGCAGTDGDCSYEDINEDGYDDVSYEAGANSADPCYGVVCDDDPEMICICGECTYEDEQGDTGGNDCTDCNYDGIPDDCEETYTYGYNVGYMNGVITGQINADENNDGLVDNFPLITVLGGTVQVLTQSFDSEYTDAGASCFVGETDLTTSVWVSGSVANLTQIGTYVMSYDCQDNVSGNQAITKYRTVIVQAGYLDENNDGLIDDFPLITILGGTVVVLTQTFEGNYVDAGATCFVGDAEISQNVEVSGAVVNLASIGTYVISYNCQDSVSGNQAMTKSRTVIVQADYTDEDNDGYDDVSYTTGLEEGILLGAESGDANGDGVLNVLDIVYFVDIIMNP